MRVSQLQSARPLQVLRAGSRPDTRKGAELSRRRIHSPGSISPAITVDGVGHSSDSWTNASPQILSKLSRRLHIQPSHPLSLTRELISSRFPAPTYAHYTTLPPIVSTHQNFDSLGFPLDHPGRSRTDTYYLNSATCLRTHTSAHQADTFRANASDGYTITADVYRRDAIDRSHYPIFHQMEGARVWDRQLQATGSIADRVNEEVASFARHDLHVEDPNPVVHAQRNPLQPGHSIEEVEAMASHLKRTLEGVVTDIFHHARAAALAAGDATIAEEAKQPLQVRWVEAYFPFTSPSWELEVFWQGSWLELLGCGIVSQPILNNAGVGTKLGWAFGLGLERIAMLLYSIPDIRLFWSQDPRFLDQFGQGKPISRFMPFSKYPASPRDVAFWLREQTATNAAGGASAPTVHENDVMEIVRDVGGDLVESVRLVDEFKHPKTGRSSSCYRIDYRSLERSLSRDEANELHERIKQDLVHKLGVELR